MNRLLATMMKDILNCKDIIVEDVEYIPAGLGAQGEDDVPKLIIGVRPKAKDINRCPVCGRKCRRDGNSTPGRLWRHTDLNGIVTYVKADTHRVECPEHGSHIAAVPWAYAGSYFTRDFDRMIAAFARELPKSFVAEWFRIDWHTVGRCISRTLNDLEPDRSKRLEGLKILIVDETSFRKGHKYITVVLNGETREVIWVHLNHGKEVFEEFCKTLTEEQRAGVEIVAGDGAKWIDTCKVEYFPNATRCVDPFHVVTWANDALDSVRLDAWRNAKAELRKLEKERKKLVSQAAEREQADEVPMQANGNAPEDTTSTQAPEDAASTQAPEDATSTQVPEDVGSTQAPEDATSTQAPEDATSTQAPEDVGSTQAPEDAASTQAPEDVTPSATSRGNATSSSKPKRKLPVFTPEEQELMDALNQRIKESKAEVTRYKGSLYALGKAPEHLTTNQKAKLEMIATEDQDLYRAYCLKERLRLILKMDITEGREELADWIVEARCCGITAFEELAEKILRHAENIENFMKTGVSSAAIEATNNKIKLALRKAYGFRNPDNMIDMVYFVCSNINVPRPYGGSFPRTYSSKGLFRHDGEDFEQQSIA